MIEDSILNKDKTKSSKKIKLLMGITLSDMGGAQKVVYDIIASLNIQKYDITLVTSSNGILTKWIEHINLINKTNIKIKILSCLKRNISPINDIKTLYLLFKMLKSSKYDIVHFHSSKIGILGRLASWFAKVPIIIFTVHGWGINEYQNAVKQFIFGFFEWYTGIVSSKVICVSKYDFNKGIKNKWITSKKACVIYNGITTGPLMKGRLKRELNIEDDTIIIGTVMRLQEPKKPLFTIQVFHAIKRIGFNVKLVIIGDGNLYMDCIALISELGLNEDVFLIGEREDARELMNDFDVFTLFSKIEGLPITIIEAMSAGKPVVASNVGGIPELVLHEETGFLLEFDEVQIAAYYIQCILKNEKLRYSLGEYGKKIANERFTLEKMIEAYETIYDVMIRNI